jgi:MFS family permease
VVGAVLVLMMASSATPSPMYVVYQHQWQFSSGVLTLIFGVYALAVLVSLLVFGALSDTVGRRPVLLVATGLVLLSMVLFATANGVGWLISARVLQGIGVGTATGALSAALIELSPPHAPGRGTLVSAIGPPLGQGLGALGAGVLVEYAPLPTVLPYLLLLAGFAALVAIGWYLPETAPGAGGPLRIRPRRLAVPAGAGRPFALLSLSILALWSLGGLFASLGASFVVGLLHSDNHMLGGLVVAVLAGTGAVGQLACGRLAPYRALLVGTLILLPGVVLVITAVLLSSSVLFFAAGAVMGFGWGACFLGAFRAVSDLADPRRRGELLAALYVVAYLGMSVPSIVAGFASAQLGLRGTAIVFFVAVAVLALAGLSALPSASSRPGAQVAGTGPGMRLRRS